LEGTGQGRPELHLRYEELEAESAKLLGSAYQAMVKTKAVPKRHIQSTLVMRYIKPMRVEVRPRPNGPRPHWPTPEAFPVADKGILKSPFGKICKYMIQEHSKGIKTCDGTTGFLIQPRALDALQHSAEEYLVKLFADARLAMLQRVRPQKGRGEGELLLRDLQLARRLYGISDTGGIIS
jgi:histone H3/H4